MGNYRGCTKTPLWVNIYTNTSMLLWRNDAGAMKYVSTYLNKEEYEAFLKWKTQNGFSEKSSDYAAFKKLIRLGVAGHFDENPIMVMAQEIEQEQPEQNETELMKLLKRAGVNKDIGARGGDLWQNFLRESADKHEDPAEFEMAYRNHIEIILRQAKRSGINPVQYLVSKFGQHRERGMSNSEKMDYYNEKRAGIWNKSKAKKADPETRILTFEEERARRGK